MSVVSTVIDLTRLHLIAVTVDARKSQDEGAMNVNPPDIGSLHPPCDMGQVGSLQVEFTQNLESYKHTLVCGRFVDFLRTQLVN